MSHSRYAPPRLITDWYTAAEVSFEGQPSSVDIQSSTQSLKHAETSLSHNSKSKLHNSRCINEEF